MGKQPSPGNVRGGITTVEEKALGDILKGGHSPLFRCSSTGSRRRLQGCLSWILPERSGLVTGLVAPAARW